MMGSFWRKMLHKKTSLNTKNRFDSFIDSYIRAGSVKRKQPRQLHNNCQNGSTNIAISSLICVIFQFSWLLRTKFWCFLHLAKLLISLTNYIQAHAFFKMLQRLQINELIAANEITGYSLKGNNQTHNWAKFPPCAFRNISPKNQLSKWQPIFHSIAQS